MLLTKGAHSRNYSQMSLDWECVTKAWHITIVMKVKFCWKSFVCCFLLDYWICCHHPKAANSTQNSHLPEKAEFLQKEYKMNGRIIFRLWHSETRLNSKTLALKGCSCLKSSCSQVYALHEGRKARMLATQGALTGRCLGWCERRRQTRLLDSVPLWAVELNKWT